MSSIFLDAFQLAQLDQLVKFFVIEIEDLSLKPIYTKNQLIYWLDNKEQSSSNFQFEKVVSINLLPSKLGVIRLFSLL